METSGVSSTTSGQGLSSAAMTKNLDRDAFLKLLIAELQNQDPLKPMEDKDFIAQLAQFSSLEQMQQLNQAFEAIGKNEAATRAFAMIGKKVDYVSSEGDEPATGYVDGIVFDAGLPVLEIGSARVGMERVVRVYR
jgi:flagellar basal-body rod modification protein FlgD